MDKMGNLDLPLLAERCSISIRIKSGAEKPPHWELFKAVAPQFRREMSASHHLVFTEAFGEK